MLPGDFGSDGYMLVEEVEQGRRLVPTEADSDVEYSHLLYPKDRSG